LFFSSSKLFTPLAAVNSIDNDFWKMAQDHFSVSDHLDDIDRRNIDFNNGILQLSTVVNEHTTFNRQDDSSSESLSDLLNEQTMPDVDMADESSIQLPSHYDQGTNIA
jgi:hypothetical protein